jgi:hypothetical protein
MRLQKSKYYTTLDVRGVYNLIRMAEGEEWKCEGYGRLPERYCKGVVS